MTTAAEASPAASKVPQLLLLLLLALAAFLQLTVVSKTVVDHPLRADAGEYFSYAWNLRNHGVYSSARPTGEIGTPPAPDKVRSPGYPLFLLAVGNPEPSEQYLHRVSLVQALLGVGSVWLIYLIAASFLPRGLALVAGLLTALSPHLTMTSAYLLTEAPFTFLLLAGTLATIRAASSLQPRTAALAGLLWGACALVRPTVQFLPLLFLLLAVALPALRRFRRPALVSLLVFCAVLAPWVIRNATVDQPGPSLMVNSVAHGAYPDFQFDNRPETFGFPYRFDPDYPAHIESPQALLAHLGDSFGSEPGRYARWFLVGKPYFFLSLKNVQALDIQIYPTPSNPYYERPLFAVIRDFAITAHWPLMVLGLLGVALVASRVRGAPTIAGPTWLPAAIVALVVLYAIGLHMVVAPFPRYAIPFRPLIYALALVPIHALWSAVRGRQRA